MSRIQAPGPFATQAEIVGRSPKWPRWSPLASQRKQPGAVTTQPAHSRGHGGTASADQPTANAQQKQPHKLPQCTAHPFDTVRRRKPYRSAGSMVGGISPVMAFTMEGAAMGVGGLLQQ
jgi:hypothetical protein